MYIRRFNNSPLTPPKDATLRNGLIRPKGINYIFVAGTAFSSLPSNSFVLSHKTQLLEHAIFSKTLSDFIFKAKNLQGPTSSLCYIVSVVLEVKSPCPLAQSPWNGGWTISLSHWRTLSPGPSLLLETGAHTCVKVSKERTFSPFSSSFPSFL